MAIRTKTDASGQTAAELAEQINIGETALVNQEERTGGQLNPDALVGGLAIDRSRQEAEPDFKLTSLGGSFCWFIAFTLQNAAYVKALGQVELLLSIAATTLFFHEKISPREWAGMAVLVGSILMLVLVT